MRSQERDKKCQRVSQGIKGKDTQGINMLKSALNYFTAEPGGESNSSAGEAAGGSDRIIGSTLDVGGQSVRVRRQIGEGGFAFVYAVDALGSQDEQGRKSGPKSLALKRLLAVDQEKRTQIVQEITYLKNLKSCDNILQFVRAANLQKGLSATGCEEFLLLTELCVGSLYDYLSVRVNPYPPETVGRIFFQTLEAVSFMHRSKPPIIHRDLKIENLLISSKGQLKLCDFGSATTQTYSPDETWNMSKRTAMEEELAKFTTPMYRSPEMVDAWSNFPVDTACDIWALGCILFQLSFHRHPFEDGAKLRIINANFSIPETDQIYNMFHDLIRQTLAIDPTFRPSCQQLQEHLGEVSVLNSWDLEAKINFEVDKDSFNEHMTTQVKEQEPQQQSQQQQKQSGHALAPESVPHSSSASNLISSFRGNAGNVFRNIKESSMAVVGSILAPKDLDFHLLTKKIAAMSFPSDGIDLTYKNQLEDVRQVMESRHADHYAIVNLCERKYPANRIPRGTLIDPNWTTQVTPSLWQLLEATMKTLEFLGQNRQNVVVIHCLDGKSNTAMLFTAITIVCKVFSRYESALEYFEKKRCEPVLSSGQRRVLKELEKVAKNGPSVQLPMASVSISSVVLEPVPLFTKANDGVRPFIEVYSDSKLVGTTFKDYASLQFFNFNESEVILKTGNIKVPPGDVSVIVYHARQSLGSFFASSKVDKIRICQVYFDPGRMQQTRTFIRFRTHELDNIGDLERIPADFSVTVNFKTNETKTTKFPYILPEKRKLDLVFQTRGEFEEAMTCARNEPPKREPDHAPERPPRKEKQSPPPQPSSRPLSQEIHKPPSLVDLEGSLGHHPSRNAASSSMPKSASLLDFGHTPQAEEGHDSPIVENIFPEKPPSSSTTTAAAAATHSSNENAFFDLSHSGTQNAEHSIKSGSGFSDHILLDFGSDSFSNVPRVPQPQGQKQTFHQVEDLFASPASNSHGDSGLLNPTSIAPTAPSNSSQGPKDAPPPTKMTGSEMLVDELLGNLNLTAEKNSSKPAASMTGPSRPNYNRSFFDQTPQHSNSASNLKKATFEDLLGGFTPSSSDSANKTIGEMKKAQEKRNMDPDEALIFEWTHGKSRNLRALLCSLDTVIWTGSRWTKCGMHQLVTHNDVKKMYRKACLAVHPDKQMGTDNEKLSKMIFTELNDGWAKFQEDESPS